MKKLILISSCFFFVLSTLLAGVEPAIVAKQPGTAFLANAALNHKIATPVPFFVATGGATPP